MENEPFSTELLRRIPQKLFLNEHDYPGWLPVLVFGTSWLGGGGWIAFSTHAGWGKQAAAIGAAACLLAGYALWLVITGFAVPVLRARGWYPMVEYLPDEGKIIVADKPGGALWGVEHAVVTVYLDSISGIGIESRETGWTTSIHLRKGDPIVIASSVRGDHAAASELAATLAAMISVPLRLPPTPGASPDSDQNGAPRRSDK
ncbi:MAG TPA: hypothetical protein PLP29_08560 [Candidatus Ozemobacteraceae bacterium]|nr:hypothetical protein [Candidatus Ozemobacteraceae bacterium]